MMATVQHAIGPLRRYLDDKKAIEIKVNHPGQLHIELKSGEWKRVEEKATDLQYWERLARAVSISTGQSFSERLPVVKAKLPGGHRLFLMLGPNVIGPGGTGAGVAAAIRLYRGRDYRLTDFGVPEDVAAYLEAAIRERKNVLVAGGTGSGKTTLANILCGFIEDAAPVCIEDTEELILRQPVAARLLVSPATADTDLEYHHVLDALTRMRPDRVILGELTVDNAFITMRTLNMGVDGMLTTLHADSADEAIPALSELLALRGYSAPHAETFFRRKIGVCVHCAREADRRLITEIVEPGEAGATVVWRRSHDAQIAQAR